MKLFRIGHGYDVHRFTENRPLILCGVQVPYEYGLLGHSDADVAVHALCDALLGSLALGDIGKHFPDTDPQYKNADSMHLLAECCRLIKEKGYTIANADITIIAQKPKLAKHIEKMRSNVAQTLEVSADRISVKATTEEGLGFTGSLEGISAHAVALIEKIN